MLNKIIYCLLLLLCRSLHTDQWSLLGPLDEEYKTLLFELTGSFEKTEVAIDNETYRKVHFKLDVWPVNVSFFSEKEVFYVREQIPPDVIRNFLLTVHRENRQKVVIDRYNFTSDVKPPDDPTGSEFFRELKHSSIISLPLCNATLAIHQAGARTFTGNINLCEFNEDNPPEYINYMTCDWIQIWNHYHKNNSTIQYRIIPVSRRDFPPDWNVNPC